MNLSLCSQSLIPQEGITKFDELIAYPIGSQPQAVSSRHSSLLKMFMFCIMPVCFLLQLLMPSPSYIQCRSQKDGTEIASESLQWRFFCLPLYPTFPHAKIEVSFLTVIQLPMFWIRAHPILFIIPPAASWNPPFYLINPISMQEWC